MSKDNKLEAQPTEEEPSNLEVSQPSEDEAAKGGIVVAKKEGEGVVAELSEDSSLDNDNDDDDLEPPEDMIIGHYDKEVTRTKNKFKISLVDLMIRIKGKDYIL